VVSTANRHLILYQLDNAPQEFKRIESPLKYQHRCVSVFKDKKTGLPAGFALGSIEGRVAIQYINPQTAKVPPIGLFFTLLCFAFGISLANGALVP